MVAMGAPQLKTARGPFRGKNRDRVGLSLGLPSGSSNQLSFAKLVGQFGHQVGISADHGPCVHG